MSSVIQISDLSKLYRLGDVGAGSLAHDFNRFWHKLRGKADPYVTIAEENDRTTRGQSEYVWALKNISFEVQQGEVAGIIGKNGAGKSTLLKILSRTTGPTSGTVKLRGRVASLLEVGTGFHPELTGRENIYLNGAILGMHKPEIKQKFDEIVDFSGIERFIDTPVKRYSSGMYVRLAFAVAAHLEPDILIIDEVLAVGDVEFQRKALGKMKLVSNEMGRTVLFVSHNMQAISTLTKNCFYLEKGKLVNQGDTADVIGHYLASEIKSSDSYFDDIDDGRTKVVRVELLTSEAGNTQVHGESFIIEVDVFLTQPLAEGNVTLQVFNIHGVAVTQYWIFDGEKKILRSSGLHKLKCVVPKCRLFYGKYTLTVYLTERTGSQKLQILKNICPFDVEMFNSQREHPWHKDTSLFLDDFYWETD